MTQRAVTRATDAFRMAIAAFQSGNFQEAESMCRKTRALAPSFFGASLMLGRLLQRRGAIAEAAIEFVRASKLAPNDFDSHQAAGTVLAACGRVPEAIEHLEQACAIDPASVAAHFELGTALRSARRVAEAVLHFREVVRLEPAHGFGHNNLGVALLDLWQLDDALDCLVHAIEHLPQLAEAHFNLANTLKELGRVSEAVTAYRRAIELRPDYHDAHSNLLFAMMFDPKTNMHDILREAKEYQTRHLTLRSDEVLSPLPRAATDRVLRVGYVCADFREHVFMLLLPRLILEHDREKFEIYCYSNVQVPDAVTQLYSERADHFRSIVMLDDAAAARLIHDDGIDVLIDITMHMASGRLGVFARRPAPLQIAWLAYPGTTGAECIDFRLSDPHLDPPGTEDHYSERTARLPETFWCYDPMISDLPVNDLPAKKTGHLTFGCLNNFCKTNELTFSLWALVLRSIPTSHLILLAPPGSARERTCAIFERHGIASERIEFVDFQPRSEYLKTYWRIDLALDTFPYNGHTTSLDAWWMGVPVVSMVGEMVAGRAGLSQARNLGLNDLIAHTPEEFCSIAMSLGSDPDYLAALRSTLRERLEKSPLMDGQRFARHFEQTLLDLFQHVSTRSRDL